MRPIPIITFAFAGVCIASSLLGSACSSSSEATHDPQPANNALVSELSFNVWKCEDLECLNLETLETTMQTYTACAAVLSDADDVGVQICERKQSSVVSRPARCQPMGTACPSARLAYDWDTARRERDGGPPPDNDSGATAPAPPAPPPSPPP